MSDKTENIIIFSILASLVIAAIVGAIFFINDYKRWAEAPVFEKTCILTSSQFIPSTYEHHTGIGVGIGPKGPIPVVSSYSTGHSEKRATVWHCEDFGNFVSEDSIIFQNAKPESILLFKKLNNEIRLVGIK